MSVTILYSPFTDTLTRNAMRLIIVLSEYFSQTIFKIHRQLEVVCMTYRSENVESNRTEICVGDDQY